MTYNTRNQSNVTTESLKEKKITSKNKMWSLKSLAMLRCESRTSLHAVK